MALLGVTVLLDPCASGPRVTQKNFELLPADHPAKVQSLLVFARPPANFRHLVEVTLDGVSAAQLELSELEGRRLALNFPGTTAQDVAAISAAGGTTREATEPRLTPTPPPRENERS